MLVINAEIRSCFGKNANRKLQCNDKFPAIIYNKLIDPISISIKHNEFSNIKNKEHFYKKTLILNIENKEKIKVKVQSVQYHPFKLKVIHVDFLKI